VVLKNVVEYKSQSLLPTINCISTFEGAWSNDLICNGLVHTQLRTKSWVRRTLGFGPIVDEAEHLEFVVSRGAMNKGELVGTVVSL